VVTLSIRRITTLQLHPEARLASHRVSRIQKDYLSKGMRAYFDANPSQRLKIARALLRSADSAQKAIPHGIQSESDHNVAPGDGDPPASAI
jgi:mannose-6-phosphate isomerase class I